MPGLPELPPGEFVLPYYDGLSIANIPATVTALLGGELPPHPTLPPDIWAGWALGLRRVVLVLLDGLGHLQLQRQAADPDLAVFARMAAAGAYVPLTSVFPSTTTAALLTFWTGRMPAEHGMLGYEMYLREYGVLANMISLSPVYERQAEMLHGWGFDPEQFTPAPGLAAQLNAQGIGVRDLIAKGLMHSGLSRILRRGGVKSTGYATLADMWTQLRQILEEEPADGFSRELIMVYWPGVDSVGHGSGPDSASWPAEVRALAWTMDRELLAPLSPAAREGTLLLVTADHGQVSAPPEQATLVGQHPGLEEHLTVPVSGDARAAFLFARDGRRDQVCAYFAGPLAGRFTLLDSGRALAAGLFGPGTPAPETRFRIGDLLAIARGANSLNRGSTPALLQGRHAGLLSEEMLVPFLGARLESI